ncbi:hypothetical protein BY458DRAFT_521454, partial [Sporodiniella umbellata]
MRRSFAWSRVGTCPVVKTTVARTVTHTILGAMADTVIHLSLRKPAPTKPKPKKAEANKKRRKMSRPRLLLKNNKRMKVLSSISQIMTSRHPRVPLWRIIL